MLYLLRGLTGALLLLAATSFLSFDRRSVSTEITRNPADQVSNQNFKRNYDQVSDKKPTKETPGNEKNFKRRKILTKVEHYELFLHAAFLDNRFHDTTIRILGMQRKDEQWQSLNFTCLLFFKNETVCKTDANRYFIDQTWPWWGYHYGVMIDCRCPKLTTVDSVTLQSTDPRYQFTLNIEETDNPSEKQDIAVCVKPAFGNLQVSRLVEWFETFRVLGVEKFIIYNNDLQGASRYVLDFYIKKGILTLLPYPYTAAMRYNVMQLHPETTPGKMAALDQQSYLVAMQDCLYRFNGLYKHILFLDLDEILLPATNMTLPQLVSVLDERYTMAAGYMFLTSWHFIEHGELNAFPKYLYMQRHAIGTTPILNQPKSIIRTDRAVSVNFHSVLDVPRGGYSNENMLWKDTAYVLHFRGPCRDKFEEDTCKDMLKDKYHDMQLQHYASAVDARVKEIIDFLDIGD